MRGRLGGLAARKKALIVADSGCVLLLLVGCRCRRNFLRPFSLIRGDRGFAPRGEELRVREAAASSATATASATSTAAAISASVTTSIASGCALGAMLGNRFGGPFGGCRDFCRTLRGTRSAIRAPATIILFTTLRRGRGRVAIGSFYRGTVSLDAAACIGGCVGGTRRAFFHFEDLVFDGADNGIVFIVVFEEVGNVEKRVAFQSNVNKGGLHSGQHACDTTFMDTAGEGIFFFALVEKLNYLIVFKNRYADFVASR
jgi:hypothetical protein